MIELSGLTKTFGDLRAADNIGFSVAKGEVLGFLGPNGAGKSTTMKMVTGFLTPDRGTARICGYDILSDPLKAQSRLGYLPEGAPAYGDMTPDAFLSFIADIRGLTGAYRAERLAACVRDVRIAEVMHRPIDTLSKGYKRRVGLAQAILHDPDVLILDEPTDGLDPNQQEQVRQLIRAMAPEKAIIISTHILGEVESICSRAIIVNRGAAVFDGTPEALQEQSRYHNAVTVRLVDPVGPTVAEAVAGLPGIGEVEQVELQQFTALSEDGRTISGIITDCLADRKWPIREMHVERGRIDDVFRTLTQPDPTV